MATKAAIYARVMMDTPGNEDNRTGVQVMKCKEYCRQNAWGTSEEFIFMEPTPSIGHDGARPVFDKMMALATQKDPPFKAIVVLEMARFMRDRDMREMARDKLLANGVKLAAIKDGAKVF